MLKAIRILSILLLTASVSSIVCETNFVPGCVKTENDCHQECAKKGQTMLVLMGGEGCYTCACH